MTDYRIRIIVEGEDRASGPLSRVGAALGGMGQVAGGIIGAQALMGIARGIIGIGTGAIGATANLQAMEIGLASLAAREIANAENTQRLADATAAGLDTTEVALMKISDALPQAEGKAKAMMEELAKLALVSPYQLDVVSGSYQMAQAFGYTGEEAMKFTKALLNVGAGVGADNERLSRMAYNLAQIRMVGKVTAIDFRQLAMAGFDLGSVLTYAGEQAGVAVKDYNDFNKALETGQITWEQFTDSFMKYAEENFGGASERMSRTLKGLASTFQDLFILTFPKMLGPAAETFTGFANKILDAFLKIRDSGILEDLAAAIDSWMQGVVANLTPFVDNFTGVFDAIADAGFGSSEFNQAMGKLIGDDDLTKTRQFIGVIKDAVAAIQPFVTAITEFITNNVAISDVLMAIGIVIASSVIPALLSAAAAFAPFLALVGIIALVRNAWQNNWLGMRDTLTQAWTTTIYPALQQLWTWLQVNVPLAIAWLSNAWQTNFLPVLQTVWGWVQTNVFPLLAQLWQWLQVNVPIAVAFLSDLWMNTLLPAIQAVGNWFLTVLFPALQQLWDWLAVNVPQAIQTLSDFWNNTLLPAVTAVMDYVNTTIIPFWDALIEVLSALGEVTITALAGFWQNVLQPALQTIGDVLNVTLIPAFTAIGDYIKSTLQPIGEGFASFLSGALKKAFDGITEAIKNVTTWLSNLATKIGQIKLPSWLTPGSPTPFEIGLRGIADALKDVNALMQPNFSLANAGAQGTIAPRNPVSTGEAGGGTPINITQNFYDEGAAAIGMAEVAHLRRQRLSNTMGA